MKTVAEYRAYATESRRLVASVPRPEDKQALEKLARAWDNLADEREARLLKQIDGDTLIHQDKALTRYNQGRRQAALAHRDLQQLLMEIPNESSQKRTPNPEIHSSRFHSKL
jgi:hypothetical protein